MLNVVIRESSIWVGIVYCAQLSGSFLGYDIYTFGITKQFRSQMIVLVVQGHVVCLWHVGIVSKAILVYFVGL